MTIIDKDEQGFSDIAWSPDARSLVYCKQGAIYLWTEGDQSPRRIDEGECPACTAQGAVLFSRDDAILRWHDGRTAAWIRRDDIISGTPKRRPCVSRNGKLAVFTVDNVYHKESHAQNAYPYRTFVGIANADGKATPRILGQQQWYGGSFCWFPGSSKIAHHEYDSTGGARIHVVTTDGEEEALLFGLYPSVSPDGKKVACKPKGGMTVVVYASKDGFFGSPDVHTTVCKIPEGGRPSASPPQWLDNRHLLVDEGDAVFRVDVHNQSAEVFKKIPTPVVRGCATMLLDPPRKRVAVETEDGHGFALQVVNL